MRQAFNAKVDAILDFSESNIMIIPDQSGVKSVDLHSGQTFPTVTALHFLHATSLNYL